MSENKAKEKSKDLLLEVYGGKSFLKIYQALGIGKIKFSFAEKGKEKEGIDCYVNADDFVCDFIAKIRNREFLKLADAEKRRAKEAKEQFCKPIWMSRAGLTTDNKIRSFSLQPGSSTPFVFRATEKTTNITVGLDYRELELLEYRWRFLEKDWNSIMEKKYCLSAMRDLDREKYYSSQVNEQTESPADLPQEKANAKNDVAPKSDEKEKPRFMSTGSGTKSESPKNTASADDKAKSSQTPPPPTLNFRMKVTVAIAKNANGNAFIKAVTEDGTEYVIVFNVAMINSVPNWADYEKKFSSVGTIISFTGKVFGNRIMAEKVA